MRDYNFGNFISELRQARGLSQYQLGALVGVTNKAVSKWENGTSKPKSALLHKIADVLDITVDELLNCKLKRLENERKDFLMKQLKLWERAQAALEELYSSAPPIEIFTRFSSERAILDGKESFTFLDTLSALTAESDAFGYDIIVRGTLASSFVAYLLGATKVNPLPAHYRCPRCKRVIMMHDYADGWDLPHRVCDCGAEMIGDGHSIPFDSGGIEVRKVCVSLVIASSFWDKAINTLKECAAGYSLLLLKDTKGKTSDYLYFLPPDESRPSFAIESFSDERYDELYSYPYFSLLKSEMLEDLHKISLSSGVCADLTLASSELLEHFRSCDTDGVQEFSTDFMKEILRVASPKSFHELIKLSGFAHGTGTWLEVGKPILESGCATLSEIPAFRDDVFELVLSKAAQFCLDGASFAYEVASNTRKGRYAIRGMSEQTRRMLLEIGVSEWLCESFCKIFYMFPKAHCIYYVKSALKSMWFKIHYPIEFERIFLKK